MAPPVSVHYLLSGATTTTHHEPARGAPDGHQRNAGTQPRPVPAFHFTAPVGAVRALCRQQIRQAARPHRNDDKIQQGQLCNNGGK